MGGVQLTDMRVGGDEMTLLLGLLDRQSEQVAV